MNSVSETLKKDHPRMRGEDHMSAVDDADVHGSPPHARGRQIGKFSEYRPHWITPACAGKTYAFRGETFSVRDHPRMRGEDVLVSVRRSPSTGSPPHARGRPLFQPGSGGLSWITPACAGKTAKRVQTSAMSWDHPRMRGEDSER